MPTFIRRHFGALGVLTVVVLVATLMHATGAAAATAYGVWDDFESGTDQRWSSANVSVSPEAAEWGGFGARATSDLTQAGYLNWDSNAIAQNMRYGRIRGWVKVVSAAPGQSVDVMTLQNAAGWRHFDFFRDPYTGKWKYDLYSGDSAVSTMPATFGEWFYVEALVDYGGPLGDTYTADVRINGIDQPSIVSTNQVGTTVRSAWFGGPRLLKINTRDYDNLRVDVADVPLSFTR